MDCGSEMNRYKLHTSVVLFVLSLLYCDLSFCCALNSEGLALLKFREAVIKDPYGALLSWDEKNEDINPCSWSGIECSDGHVVSLNMKNSCLGGTLAPEIGQLSYLRSIILRNNSFSGSIPEDIAKLKDLEVLDLGYNNFSGPLPFDLGNNISLTTLLLDNNAFIGRICPELQELRMLSEFQVDEKQLSGAGSMASCVGESMNWDANEDEVVHRRRQLQALHFNIPFLSNSLTSRRRVTESSQSPSPSLPPSTIYSPSPSLAETPTFSPTASPSSNAFPPSQTSAPEPTSSNPPVVPTPQPQFNDAPVSSPLSFPTQTVGKQSESKKHRKIILGVAIGVPMFVMIVALGIFFFHDSGVVPVKPWATGLSGQLQKAFVTGVPKLKRSELEAACEDFSNIIGTFPGGTVYKGTLSTGVEIAVTSSAVNSCEDWSRNLEAQFRKKIETLSRVNHKNFVNLIGFCEENEPFTRMMVFEYAPNGTLFEHLHILESEHLEWGTRLRISMGVAYCLEYMHQLNPPVTHKNLQSSSIHLTEDYAAKISDFSLWNDVMAAKMRKASKELPETPLIDPKCNVFSFGIILLELITGQIPYSEENGSLAEWVTDCLRGAQNLREMVDPTLKSFNEDELEKLLYVIKKCTHSDSNQRPIMKDVVAELNRITEVGPDGAMPRLSPLWWAELEIMSSEGS